MKKLLVSLLIAVVFWFTLPLGSFAYASTSYTPQNTISLDTSWIASQSDTDTHHYNLCITQNDFSGGTDHGDTGSCESVFQLPNGWTGTHDISLVDPDWTNPMTIGTTYYAIYTYRPDNSLRHLETSFVYSSGGGGEVMGSYTIEPTQQAQINEAVGSIPVQASTEVFSILPYVLPFILVFVAIGVAFVLVRRFIKNKGEEIPAESENSWIEHSDQIHDHINSDH